MPPLHVQKSSSRLLAVHNLPPAEAIPSRHSSRFNLYNFLHCAPLLAPAPAAAPAAGSGGDVFLSWHAPSRRVLAVGVGGKVLLVSVPLEGMEQLEFELDDNSTPGEARPPAPDPSGDWLGSLCKVGCAGFLLPRAPLAQLLCDVKLRPLFPGLMGMVAYI